MAEVGTILVKQEFLPTTNEGKLFRLIEECNEVRDVLTRIVHHCCKMGRFGPDGDADWCAKNDMPSPRQRVLTDLEELEAELADLHHAIAQIREVL